MSNLKRTFAAAIVVLFCSVQSFAALHPFHVSRAEIEYNGKRKTFEVAICVWPDDLEKAVSKSEDKLIEIDSISEKSRDRVLSRYVAKSFLFVPSVKEKKEAEAESKPAPIRWVGSEFSLKQAWLYFEVDAKANSEDWIIENQMLFEIHEDQLNLVQIKNERDLKTLTLSTSEPATKWSRSPNQ